MLKRSVQQVPPFVAGDQTLIREVLHPGKEAVDLPYSLAYATIEPGKASKAHRLQSSSEVYVFVRGHGRVFINDHSDTVAPGDVIHIPAGADQYVSNDGEEELAFWCIVAPAWSKDDELVL